jgi:hypothetical protein
MTTYILAGGNDRSTPGYGERLAAEITKLKPNPHILSCFYAWPEAVWEDKAKTWHEWFEQNFGPRIGYDYASKDRFLSQIDTADVVYLHGGNTAMMLDALPDASQLKAHFEGKIVVGSSAGANVLSTNFWSSTKARPLRGLGLVKLNIMVHYGKLTHEKLARTSEDWRREEAEFAKFINGLNIVRLPEGQFIKLAN